MITGIREKAIVRENGTIEIDAADLPIGAKVEVIVLIEEDERDTTEYLLSTEANRRHLMESMRDAANPEKLIRVDIDGL